MRTKLILLLILLLSFGIVFPGRANSDPNSETDSGSKESNKVNLQADRVQQKKKKNLQIATGNVKFDFQDNNVQSNKLKMYEDTNILVFTEEVKLKRPNETITSELIELDSDNDQLVAQDNVVLDTKKNDKELHLTSEYLKLWLKTDDILARRNVEMDYDGQQIRGENLEYNAEKEEMVITEKAEIKEDEQWIKSDKIIVDLETGSIDATGQVEMEFEFGE